MMLDKTKYAAKAVAAIRDEALDWVTGESPDAFPRSWAQESANDEQRGYQLYEYEHEAPPIAGYEALEAEGKVERIGVVGSIALHNERVHFRLKAAE